MASTEDKPPPSGSLVMSVGQVARPGQELRLASVAGAPDMVYPWPLTVGKGSVKKGEDEHDQAVEILDTIRWVSDEHPELRTMMGDLLHSYNKTSWESMNRLTSTFNESVKKLLNDERTEDIAKARLHQRPNRKLLKHILQQVYNTAIADPNDLNQYAAFTPEVYGETSFDLVCQMIDLISPITQEMKFIDLGSGVGQVVLQVAALVDCELCVGVEKAVIPAARAKEMDRLFKVWMAWYGKKYSPFELHEGDFLAEGHRKTISSSKIVFVNNFAFGPEVDHHLKERFAELSDGSRIVSSKPFCPLNFRITERNLSDIGTIMHVSQMDPLKGSVSWTDKPVSYYLHQIDTSKLERYFIRQQSQQAQGFRRRHGLLDDAASSSHSRASSLDPDSPNTLLSTNSGEDSDPTVGSKGKPRRGRPNKKKFTKKKSTPRPEPRVKKVTEYLKSLEVNMNGMDPTPDTSVTESGPNSRCVSPHEDQSTSGPSGRPVRAAVVTAAAISVAQNDILAKFDSTMGETGDTKNSRKNVGTGQGRGRGNYKKINDGQRLPQARKVGPGTGGRSKNNKIANLDELDMMHHEAITQIEQCNVTAQLPSGCVDEKLNVFTPSELIHQEVPFHVSHVTTSDGQQIPYGLHVLLESMKKQYVKMVQQMQSKEYHDTIQNQIDKEKERKELLTKRVKQLENQIDNLIQDSLGLLKARLKELGISADTPTEFIERAKGIVCSHNDLQKKKGCIESEIRKLELDNDALITKKEKELLDAALAMKSGSHPEVNIAELRNMVKSEIKACLDGTGRAGLGRAASPLPKVGSDVTLTKVPGPNNSQPGEGDTKKADTGVALPKVEMKFGGLEDNARSENSETQSFGKSKVMATPRANDDYEDRFKKIITTELSKPGDKEKTQTRATLSPSKGGSVEQDPRNNFVPQRRPGPEVKTEPRPFDGRGFDPRGYHQDPRSHPNSPVPRNIPVDSRFEGQRGRPADPRVLNDGGRPIHDHRIFDPRSQDPRTLEVRQQQPPSEARFINHRFGPENPPPLPRDGLLISREPGHAMRDGGPPLPREANPHPRDGRPQSREATASLPRDRSFAAQHISSEIERSLMAERGPLPPPGPGPDSRPYLPQPAPSSSAGPPSSAAPAAIAAAMSSQGIMNMTVERAIQNSQVQSSVSRLSKVIEDSVRKDAPPEKKSIYAPNSRGGPSSTVKGEEVVMEGLAMPRGTASPGDRKPSTSLPQVEGLAARFDSYFEKEKAVTGPRGPPEGLAARFSSPAPEAGASLSRPNSTSSKSSLTLHTPDLGAQEAGDNRKRPGSPVTSPTPGKKAASSSGDGSAPELLLQEINMGFDRLTAMATAMDKRRKSAENSPQQTGSPRKGASDLRLNDASFDSSSLAAKFKAGLLQGGPGPSSAQHQDKQPQAGPTLHGGNLPEHHFKKRYFNEEYQRQQQKETQESRDREQQQQARDRQQQHEQRHRQHQRQQQQQAEQEMFERSRGGPPDPGPRGHPPPGYSFPDRDRGRGGAGPGYNHNPPPRHPPPEHLRHNGPPGPPGGGQSYPRYPPNEMQMRMQMMYNQRMMYRQPHPRPGPPPAQNK